jgi:hypothetical protein
VLNYIIAVFQPRSKNKNARQGITTLACMLGWLCIIFEVKTKMPDRALPHGDEHNLFHFSASEVKTKMPVRALPRDRTALMRASLVIKK